MTRRTAKAQQTRLHQQGVSITVDQGRLQVRWVQGAMTPHILNYLRAHRQELTDALTPLHKQSSSR